jgi:hypothetical protein
LTSVTDEGEDTRHFLVKRKMERLQRLKNLLNAQKNDRRDALVPGSQLYSQMVSRMEKYKLARKPIKEPCNTEYLLKYRMMLKAHLDDQKETLDQLKKQSLLEGISVKRLRRKKNLSEDLLQPT